MNMETLHPALLTYQGAVVFKVFGWHLSVFSSFQTIYCFSIPWFADMHFSSLHTCRVLALLISHRAHAGPPLLGQRTARLPAGAHASADG